MKRLFILFTLAPFLFLSCWKPVRGFNLLKPEGESSRYYARPREKYEDTDGLREGIIRFSGADPETYSFKTAKPVRENWSRYVFSLEYSGEIPDVDVRLMYETGGEGRAWRLPFLLGGRVECLIPVDNADALSGFSLTSPGGRGVFMLIAASLKPAYRGMAFNQDKVVIQAGIDLAITESGDEKVVTMSFGDGYFEAVSPWGGLEMLVETRDVPGQSGKGSPSQGMSPNIPAPGQDKVDSPAGSARLLVTVRTESGPAVFAVTALGGEKRIHFPKALLGGIPRQADLRYASGGGIGIVEITLSGDPGKDLPIPADFGAILAYPKQKWRRTDYEYFSWSVRQDILVFDTADYAVQDELFKRLAFFIEKKGYRGKVLSNEELEGKHGWNAHDYRPDDLASFYNLSEKNGIDLTGKEKELKSILVANEIISDTGDGFRPGRGAVLSISRESSGLLRKKFLIHEGSHGLWFSSPEYRAETTAIWSGMPDNVAGQWRHFLSWMSYDPADESLTVNEFQAYCMQQPASDINSYMRRHPAFAGTVPDSADFSEEAALVSGASLKLFGLEAGTGIFVSPLSSSVTK